MNRDLIKYIAMFTMFLNHYAHAFLQAGTLPYELCLDIGYFTAISMCYFLVEGYSYTHSKKKYGIRLLVFALISQIPYHLLFGEGSGASELNMIFTLFLCFMILVIREQVGNRGLSLLLQLACLFASIFSDWGVLAPFFTMCFAREREEGNDAKRAFLHSILFYSIIIWLNSIAITPISRRIILGFGKCFGLICSAFVILYLYNGKRAEHGRNFSKWFFYCFYPGHMLLLWMALIYR